MITEIPADIGGTLQMTILSVTAVKLDQIQ